MMTSVALKSRFRERVQAVASVETQLQPYQVFFPIGSVFAVAGVGVWTLRGIGLLEGYPGLYHANWMIGGFLLSFSAGFLMTALPKFTGSNACKSYELALAAALACGQFFHLAFTAALFLFILVFAAQRFHQRRHAPPPHFIFVGLGLMLGTLGSMGIVLAQSGFALPVSFGALRVYFFQGVLLCFIVGIGARLVRVLLGYEPSPLVQIARPGVKPRASAFPSETRTQVYGSFALMAVGFLLENFPETVILGRWLRAIATSWIAFSAWRLHRLPQRRGALAWGLYAGCWSVVAGVWAYALFPGWEVHSAHVLLVGGFGTLAVMVASRVTLAHGGYPLGGEVRSLPIRAAWMLLLAAMLTRVSAPFTGSYSQHLAYAGGIAAIAFAIWGIWMSRHLRPFGE